MTTPVGPDDVRARFREERGFWNDTLEKVLEADPAFFAAYLELSAVPGRSGPLDPKVKELVHVAVYGAATFLHEPGLRIHVRRAVELGATRDELVETLQLAATLGIHACNVGVPLLLQALAEAGLRDGPAPFSPRQEELKARFEKSRGYWHEFFNGVLELDADFFEAYLDFSAHPWNAGVLEPKVKELIYIAFDAAATHMFLPGLKLHIDNAIGYGATREEIMEVFEIASGLGIHALTTGVPIVLDELSRAEAARNGAS